MIQAAWWSPAWGLGILRANEFLQLFKPVWVGCLTTCKFNIPNDTDITFAKLDLKKNPDVSRNDLSKIKLVNIKQGLTFRNLELESKALLTFHYSWLLGQAYLEFKQKSSWKLVIMHREKFLFVCFANISANVQKTFVDCVIKELC